MKIKTIRTISLIISTLFLVCYLCTLKSLYSVTEFEVMFFVIPLSINLFLFLVISTIFEKSFSINRLSKWVSIIYLITIIVVWICFLYWWVLHNKLTMEVNL
jgi:hypothetical protein